MKLIVFALAVWRLAHMVVKESGPGDIFRWLRDDDDFARPANLPPVAKQALHCVSCASIWAAALLLPMPSWVKTVLAGSAAAKLLEDYFYEESSLDGSDEAPVHRPDPFIPGNYWRPIGTEALSSRPFESSLDALGK